MRRLTIGTFLVAALLAITVGTIGLLRSGDDAQAVVGVSDPTGPGTIDALYIDMIGPNPGNGLVGPIDNCVSIANGGSQVIDVVVDEIDPADGISGYQVQVTYPNTDLRVSAVTDITGTMIDANGGTVGVPLSDGVPDTDGNFNASAADFGGNAAEFGEGTLVRITMNSIGGNGVFPLGLIFIEITDGATNPIPASPQTIGASLAVGVPCPTSTDLEASITSVVGADPIAVSNNEPYTANVDVIDNGPETATFGYALTVSIDATSSAAFLADCTTDLPKVVNGVIAADPGPQTNSHAVPFTVHCTKPSAHDFVVKAVVLRDGGVADTVPANNTDLASANLDVTAVSDLDITSQTLTPATVQFLVDNKVDNDGDTALDEDPTELGVVCVPNGIGDNDNDGLCNEDGGHVVPVAVNKTVSNLGPYGPTTVTDVMVAVQANPFAAACGISLSPFGPFTAGPIPANQQAAVPALGSANFSYTVWVHCGPSGWGYDDDGDGLDIAPLDGRPDAFIDEDIPDAVDNDGDTLVDEDGPLALPALTVENCADAKDVHISDPNPENGVLQGPGHDTCQLTTTVLQGAHPFSPSGQVTIDEVDNNLFTAPGDNDCLVTVPCKLQSHYLIPDGDVTAAHHNAGAASQQGGSPLGGVAVLEQVAPTGAFSLTHGTAVPIGDLTNNITAFATLRLIPGTPCATAGILAFDLYNGDLPGVGNPDTPNAPGLGPEDGALLLAQTWPTALDAVVSYITLVNPTAVLWQRHVGFVDVDGPGSLSPIPINELVFDLSGGAGFGPWLHFNHIGDPDFDADGLYDLTVDPDDDGDAIPDAQDPDRDNDGVPNSFELAQCAPLEVTQISLGTSQSGSPYNPALSEDGAGPGTCGDGIDNDGGAPDADHIDPDCYGPASPGSTIMRVCNIINPINPPGSFGHTDAQNFTREDLGVTTTVTSQVGCSGENDAAASICKDEVPGDQVPAPASPCPDGTVLGVDNDADTQVDEDQTLNGVDEDGDGVDGEDPAVDIVKASEEQHVNVEFDVENGTVPGDLDVQFSIVGPAACNPHWIGQAGDTVNTAILGSQQHSTITRTETGMGSGEVRYFARKYSVTCPPGAHNFNIYNNVSSASGLPDPNLNNNQAENQLQIIATPDVDNDTVPNPNDNCNWTANPAQTDTDSDGIGDACDIDDDDDGIPDGDDDCPLLPEDLDGVDDLDGCPDTDVSVDVDKDETYDVDVSTSVQKTVTITVTNGNYPANVQTNIVAVSSLGACEVRLIAQAGDTYSEFTTDETAPIGIDDTLWSQIERTDFFNAGETKIFVRNYTIHCFQNSSHSFELAVDALPLNPVQEEDLDDNVHKNFPSVTAYRLADLKKVSLAFNNPPASVKVGEAFNLNVVGTIHNNGPTTNVGYSDTLTVNLPADCNSDQGNPAVFNLAGNINTSVNTPINGNLTNVICTEQSNHQFTASNSLSVTTLHVRDPQTANNTINAAPANIVVNADADIKVQGVTVSGPVDADVNVPFNVTVAGTLHNNGPETPANVDVSYSLTVPGDCTKNPAGNQTSNDVGLVSSVATPVSKVWSVTCTGNSDHNFSGSISAVVDQIHVIDPATGNNSGNNNTIVPIFKSISKIVCDTYVGLGPVPAAPVGPAAGCATPWDGGEDEIAVSGASVTVITDHLDYSSQPVTVKVNMAMAGIAGGPQICTVDPADYDFTEAEPQGLSTGGSLGSFEITLPLPTHDGEPNWCLVEYTVTKEIDELHVESTGSLTQTVQFVVARDTDGDGVYDNALGDLDNCKLVPNAGQEDSNGNTVGDACDTDVDVLEKYITVLGPAAVNLSDNNGRYMWVIGEMGNTSDDIQQVQISISINSSPALPAGCTQSIALILPGQSTFLMLAHEQKFQVFRVRYECHAPATQQVITLTIEKCIELLPSDSQDDDLDGLIDEDSRDGVDDDGDSEDGEDPPNPDDNPGNDCQTAQKQVIIDQP